jgi:hypothetical protein
MQRVAPRTAIPPPPRKPCCAGPARALARQRALDAQTTCGDYTLDDPSMPIAADLARNRAYWSPGDVFADLVFWMRNNHSLLGLLVRHPLHPFSRAERLWVVGIQVLLVSCISWYQTSSTQREQYELAASYGRSAPDPAIANAGYGGPAGREARGDAWPGFEAYQDASKGSGKGGVGGGGAPPPGGDDRPLGGGPGGGGGPSGGGQSNTTSGSGPGYRRALSELSYEAAAAELAAEQYAFNVVFENLLLPIAASLFGYVLKQLAICRLAQTRRLERADKVAAERLGLVAIGLASLCAFGGAAGLYVSVRPEDSEAVRAVVSANLPTALVLSWFAYQVAFLALIFPTVRVVEWRRLRKLGRTPAALARTKAAQLTQLEAAPEMARVAPV